MQQTSALYKQILSQLNHSFEFKVVVDGTTYLSDQLFSLSTDVSVFNRTPEVGKTPSQKISVAIRNPDRDFPRMAEISIYVRVAATLPGDTQLSLSEWIPQGVFYSDTKTTTKNNAGITRCYIIGFDAMLKAEHDYDSTSLDWPAVDTDIVAEIASKMGVLVDSRTYDVMTDQYKLPLPVGYSLREILGILASKYLGFFVITDEGKLLLQSILSLPKETRYLVTEVGNAITFGGIRIEV